MNWIFGEAQSSVPKWPVQRRARPSFCDFARLYVILGTFRAFNAVIELLGKQVNNALNMHYITKRRQNHKNVNLARLCARLKPVFLSKKGPSKARLFTKMSPSEELGTLARGI